MERAKRWRGGSTKVSNASQPSATSAIPDKHQVSADPEIDTDGCAESDRRVTECVPSATTTIEHCDRGEC